MLTSVLVIHPILRRGMYRELLNAFLREKSVTLIQAIVYATQCSIGWAQSPELHMKGEQ